MKNLTNFQIYQFTGHPYYAEACGFAQCFCKNFKNNSKIKKINYLKKILQDFFNFKITKSHVDYLINNEILNVGNF